MISLKVDSDLELGSYTEENAEEVFNLVWENYDHLYEWSPWLDKGYSLERARNFAKLCSRQINEKTTMPLCIKLNGAIVGGTGFGEFNWENKNVEIGYWLAKNQTGKGIVTKCCRRLIDYAFDELGLNRVFFKCIPTNIKSRKIVESLDCVNEGIERQGGFHHGRFVDFAIYSMLAQDWKR